MQRHFLAAVAVLAAAALAGTARSAPPAGGPPSVTVGGHTITIEHISEHQLVTRPLAESGPEAQAAAQHRVSMLLRVDVPSAATADVDGFLGDFELVTNTGKMHPSPNEGTAFNTGSPTSFVATEDLEAGAQRLRSVTGRLRVYPRGEKLHLRLEPRVGSEAQHKNGLTVRVEQAKLARDEVVLELSAEWPESVSLRGEAEEDAFSLAAELPQQPNPIPMVTNEMPQPPAGGRRRVKITTGSNGYAAPIRSLVVEVVARTGKPVDHPFTFKDIPLPLYMADPTAPAPAAGIPAPQLVLINGQPAGPGVLEVGIAERRRAGLGPWRWERLTTDAEGRAEFRFPAPGEYRVQRRWRPVEESRAPAFAGLRWEGAGVDVRVKAKAPVRLAALAGTGTVAGGGDRAEPPVYETTVGPYRLRALRIQERAQAIIQYGLTDPQPRPRNSRYTTLTLAVDAKDALARAALEGVSVTDATEAEGRNAAPRTIELTRAPADNPNVVAVSVMFQGIGLDWLGFRRLEGELTYYPRARLVTADLPLGPDNAPEGPLGDFRDGDLLLRAFRDMASDPYSYRVGIESPADATFMMLAEQGQPPVLLDAKKAVMRTPLRSQPRVLDAVPRELRAGFLKPDTPPAFLRVPLIVRLGQPERRQFQLSGIPLPLAAAARQPGRVAAP